MRAAAAPVLAAALAFAAPAAAAPADIDSAAAPELLNCRAPGVSLPTPANAHAIGAQDYPLLSIVLGEEGATTLSIVVEADGSVSEARATKSSGSLRLDDAAAAIVKARWRYHPATMAGKPLRCQTYVAVQWHLYSDDESIDNGGFIVAMKEADYPPGAFGRDERGATVLGFATGADGKALPPVVLHSSGFADLDEQAMRLAAAKARLAPGTYDGKAVKTLMLLVMIWSGKGAAPN